jgi:hypothetical protein
MPASSTVSTAVKCHHDFIITTIVDVRILVVVTERRTCTVARIILPSPLHAHGRTAAQHGNSLAA